MVLLCMHYSVMKTVYGEWEGAVRRARTTHDDHLVDASVVPRSTITAIVLAPAAWYSSSANSGNLTWRRQGGRRGTRTGILTGVGTLTGPVHTGHMHRAARTMPQGRAQTRGTSPQQ
jgi:hypothetical protein